MMSKKAVINLSSKDGRNAAIAFDTLHDIHQLIIKLVELADEMVAQKEEPTFTDEEAQRELDFEESRLSGETSCFTCGRVPTDGNQSNTTDRDSFDTIDLESLYD